MKTWFGLLLAILGMVIGLSSTLLDSTNIAADRASIVGKSFTLLSSHSPLLIGLAIVMMIGSFLLIFSRRNDDLEY